MQLTILMTSPFDLKDFISDPSWQFYGVIASLLSIAIALWLDQKGLRRKRLTYRVLSDAPVSTQLLHSSEQKGLFIPSINTSRLSNKLSMVVIKVWNSGNVALEAEDYKIPMHFHFSGRSILSSEIFETNPPILMRFSRLHVLPQGDTLLMPPLNLNPKSFLQLSILLDGPGEEIKADGMIRDGHLKAYVSRRLVTRTNVLLAIGLMLFGVLTSLLLQRPSAPAYCASGAITLSGATTFGPKVVKKIADHYHQECPEASITFPNVSAKGSEDGLQMVHNGEITIGISNISANVSPQYADLVDHKAAVAVFAVVVNSSSLASVSNLSHGQIQGIYTGRYQRWNQIQPDWPDIPITVIGRSTGSGTRVAFDRYVLNASATSLKRNSLDCKNFLPQETGAMKYCELGDSTKVAQEIQQIQGAIGYLDLERIKEGGIRVVSIDGMAPLRESVQNGTYNFWSVEHLYTKGTPAPGSLAEAFLKYLRDDPFAHDAIIHSSYMDDLTLINEGVLDKHV